MAQINNCFPETMKLFAVIIAIYFCINQTYARRYSPLLVEDDGFRRNNRPAGKCLFFLSVFILLYVMLLMLYFYATVHLLVLLILVKYGYLSICAICNMKNEHFFLIIP